MAPRIATETQVIEGLTNLLRDRGFDAASMQDIAAASGLQKSSLYHTSWLAAFSAVARAAGLDRATATARAQDAIALIEGSLVLARVLDDTRAFERALSHLPDILLSGTSQ